MAVFGLILCVSFVVVGIEASKTYTVKPGMPASCCPGNQTECSLMYYATNSNKFFQENNTTFEFLVGDHLLENSTLIYMANISNLTLYGIISDSAQATVMCSGQQSGGFSFYNISNLRIENLNFIGCSNHSQHFRVLIALEIRLTRDLTMISVTIQNTPGYGLMIDDLRGYSSISNTTVESSHNISYTYGGNFAFYCSERYISQDDAMLQHYLYILGSNFINGTNSYNDRSSSGGIYIQISCHIKINIVFDQIVVTGNQAESGGNIEIRYFVNSYMWTASISILNSVISYGNADIGGGLFMTAVAAGTNTTERIYHAEHQGTILIFKNTTFEQNKASYVGAAVYFRLHQNYFATVGKIIFNNCTFKQNHLFVSPKNIHSHGGVGLHIVTYALPEYRQHRTLYFDVKLSKCIFRENWVETAPGYSSEPRTGVFYVQYARSVSISGCTFIKNSCTGVVAIHSNLLIHGKNTIRENTGIKGGGMLFCASSMMYLHDGTNLSIVNNSAKVNGGGIYVEDDCSQAVSYCFFQIKNITADNATLHQTQVHLINNTAQFGGTALYGGLIDNCILFDKVNQKYKPGDSKKIFHATFHIVHQTNDLSVISSDPIYIGFCTDSVVNATNSLRNCTQNTSVHVLPGSEFRVSAVLMGQHSGSVSGIVDAKCVNEHCSVPSQYLNRYLKTENGLPTDLTYIILSKEKRNVSLMLVAEDYYLGYPTYRYQPSFINIEVGKCPLGFREQNLSCVCVFQKHIKCNIGNNTVIRPSPWWIGYKWTPPKNTTDIIIHHFCPLGYCLDKNVYIQTTSQWFKQDAQCAQHRSGLLCGACRTNYSLGFGSSQCLQCKNKVLPTVRVIGLIAVCAVAGVLLVVLLTLLNLTVAEGTLNGLIFYANIIQVNLDIFFPPETKSSPLTAFIAWLNLDFGFTVCFYDGMDAYAKTWLQFLFPLYIWVISGAIVYFSRKSSKVASLAGRNAVKVLATLFLLSFGKLLRTIIAAAMHTYVQSYNGNINIRVWLVDANIPYLHGKHITLYVFAALAAVVTLLYTLTLTFIQCLRRAPNNRMCVWVRKLKPLLDAYTGPYKDKYHFWTGLLLLVRICLFISFAINIIGTPSLNFSLIIIVSTLLMIAIQLGIYRHQLVGLLESSMYVNLILFSTIMMLATDSYTSYRASAAYVFGGWALLMFLGIVTYHAYKELFGIPNCGQLRVWCQEKLRRRTHRVAVIQPVVIDRYDSDESEESEGEREMEQPLWDTPHVREPLIGSTQ